MGDKKEQYSRIPILIPAYRPDNSLIRLVRELESMDFCNIVIVDDGSGSEYQRIFDQAQNNYGCRILHHAQNLGKGHAIKTGFNDILIRQKGITGCVTTDCNGSFKGVDIRRMADSLLEHPSDLSLGKRVLEGSPDYDKKCRVGYTVLRLSFKYLVGIGVDDSQCFLRGIPVSYMKKLMNVTGEGYEYDTKMLTSCKEFQVKVRQVDLETVYTKRRNVYKYRTIKDNVPIYLTFASYIFTSVVATIVDLMLFQILKGLFNNIHVLENTAMYIPISTGLARTVSAFVNYRLNFRLVFQKKSNSLRTLRRWILLVIVQAAMSATAVTLIHTMIGGSEILIKIPVDFCLFFFSYYVARDVVYK